MYGVVLWSDGEDRKAVIWCEDHGDLAYYRQSNGECAVSLDPGDWVQFDVTIDRHLRVALNPRRVSDGVLSRLVETLGETRPDRGAVNLPQITRARDRTAEVIPFARLGQDSGRPMRQSALRQA